MSGSESKDVVSRFMKAANQGDMDTALGLLAEDLVWTDVGTHAFAGIYRGKQVVMEALIGPLLGQLKAGIHMSIERMIAEGEWVVVQAQGSAETKSGVPYNNRYCQLFRVEAGKVREVIEYCDSALVNHVFGQ